jgi:hypothetical protein
MEGSVVFPAAEISSAFRRTNPLRFAAFWFGTNDDANC